MGLLAMLKTLLELYNAFKELMGLYKEGVEKGWIQEGITLSQKLKGATTDEERKAILHAIVGHDDGAPR